MNNLTKILGVGVLGIAGYLYWKNKKSNSSNSISKDSSLSTTDTNEATQVFGVKLPDGTNPTGSSSIAPNPLDVVNTTTTTPMAKTVSSTPIVLPTDSMPVAQKNYYSYRYGAAQSGCTIYWRNKDGSAGMAFVDKGGYFDVPCMLENS
jgi:hypothetical protein